MEQEILREGDLEAEVVKTLTQKPDRSGEFQFPQDKDGNYLGVPSVHYVAEIQDIMRMYGLTEAEAKISHERRKVYGDPLDNHRGIAMGWAGLLQPHWEAIRDLKPIPAHVVALLMASLKLNRMRMVYHKDNFDDLRVYMGFAQAWQQTWAGPGFPV